MELIYNTFDKTNEEMVSYCNLLKSVLNQSETHEFGRADKKGKNQVIKKMKFEYDPKVMDRIDKSIEYYMSDPVKEAVYSDEVTVMSHDSIENDIDVTGFEMRSYQQESIDKGVEIISKYGFVYLAMEVRTGKTFTALGICDVMFVINVLFLTKKKAIPSIQADYDRLGPMFKLLVINYESLHKLPDTKWDIIICDEAHSMGAFPKPSLRAKQVNLLIKKNNSMVILLSGTPTPESFSQIYHQVYGIRFNPFAQFSNFYRFFDEYEQLNKNENRNIKKINGLDIRDYSKCSERAIDVMLPYTISLSQKEAGFVVQTNEKILKVRMSDLTYRLTSNLKKNLVIEGRGEVILGDTPVKLMMKMHQLFSGTVKFESGESMVTDNSKALFIKHYFDGKKIGIFYKFVEELSAIKSVFGDSITTELSVFEDTDKSIALQIVSGREGISLKQAECLVYYNIDFSATSYWQSRDRMTTMDRLNNEVFWIFSERGIESLIYRAVIKKKDYTIRHFERDLINL